jgi:hypothetical protein
LTELKAEGAITGEIGVEHALELICVGDILVHLPDGASKIQILRADLGNECGGVFGKRTIRENDGRSNEQG